MISLEQQEYLRRLYDAKVSKNKAVRLTGLAEATIYRYYTKWQAMEDAHQGQAVFDLSHLKPSVLEELKMQASIRGISLYVIILKLLTNAASDGLIASIIDIEDDNPDKYRLNNAKP